MGNKYIFRIKEWLREKVWLLVWGSEWEPCHISDLEEARAGKKCVFCGKGIGGKKTKNKLPPCYTLEEIDRIMSSGEKVKFLKWIYGQTCLLLDNNKPGYYKWDVDRFLEGIRRTGKSPMVWD